MKGVAVATPAGTRDTDALVAAVRDIVREELVPLEPDFLARPFRELLPVLAERRAAIRGSRPVGAAPAARVGRARPDAARLRAAVSEEMGRTPLGHYAFGCQAPDVGNMELLLRHGSPAQQERFLRAADARRRCAAASR